MFGWEPITVLVTDSTQNAPMRLTVDISDFQTGVILRAENGPLCSGMRISPNDCQHLARALQQAASFIRK